MASHPRSEEAFEEHKQRHRSSERMTDVASERIKVQTLKPKDFYNKAIICEAVHKSMGKNKYLRNINFRVER